MSFANVLNIRHLYALFTLWTPASLNSFLLVNPIFLLIILSIFLNTLFVICLKAVFFFLFFFFSSPSFWYLVFIVLQFVFSPISQFPKVTYSYACRNTVNTIKTSGHSYLEKYTSHFLFEMVRKGYERVIVWEVSWRLNKTATYWPPALLAIAALLSRSTAQPGAWGPSLFWDLVLTPQTATSDFKLWSPTNWLPDAPGLYHCLTYTCFLWRHNSHSIQPVDSQGYPLISSTGCTCYLHRCISHLTAWPGRRSIC